LPSSHSVWLLFEVRVPQDLLLQEDASMGRASSSGTCSSPSSHPFFTQDIRMLRRILAASGSSSSIGNVCSVTVVSRTKRPPSLHSGTSLWVLDSGASFHMTSDSSALSSLRTLDGITFG
jgi:hypothetical protein